MKIVICPDSFKGSLSAHEVSLAISQVIKSIKPEFKITQIPLADGGEGTGELISKIYYPNIVALTAHDPLNRKHHTRFYLSQDGNMAFVESAEIIGLPLLKPEERNPLKTTSLGLGEVISHIMGMGVNDITISLGGSATCDGGMGMAKALGFRFYDKNGYELKGNGQNLEKVSSFKINDKYNLKDLRFTVLCDVDNPLLGPKGAAIIYAPQKGANEKEAIELERGMENFSQILIKGGLGQQQFINFKGAGAAGGLGFGTMTFLGANLKKGIEYTLEISNFREEIKDADLIITGEGKIDRQSLMGKVLNGVLKEAKHQNIPVIALCGMVEEKEFLLGQGFYNIIPISNPSLSLIENMEKETALENLKKCVKSLFG